MVRAFARCIFWCLVLLGLQGCATHGGRINLESTTNHRFFTQAFNQAYVTDSGSGEYDIVLLETPGELPPKRPKNRPLISMPLAPLRQGMDIFVFWRGGSGGKGNTA